MTTPRLARLPAPLPITLEDVKETVLAAALKLGTVTALLEAWTERGRDLDASHLLAPLHTLSEAESALLNIEWTRIRDGGTS